MTLEELLPDEDYRFHLRFERGDPRDFFRPTSRHTELLAERRYWLQAAPERHSALVSDGRPLLKETIELARSWGISRLEFVPASADQDQGLSCCRALSTALEPDFLLLKTEPTGTANLVGGAVCFPSSWGLEEKIGHPIAFIHGVVPGLNDALGSQINAFLTKLKPGIAWLRINWGLSRSAELNQHPARGLPRLDESVSLEEIWLRVEHQALVALPRTQGTLFGIRIASHPLAVIRQDRALARRLTRALRTMPDAMASYKGLFTARQQLIRLLEP
jgi:hypothetical protein